jgi:hypothetical protein
MATLPSTASVTTIAGKMNAAPVNNDLSALQTPLNSLLTILSAGTANQFFQSGGGSTVQWAGDYTAYTPTWTSTGTAPAIGNATVTGRYLQIGKLVHAYGRIIFGSTSTYGTGNYAFALPVTGNANIVNLGSALIYDSSTTNSGLVAVLAASTSTMNLQYPSTWLGPLSTAGQTAPWTWAQSDIIEWTIAYEAA